MTSLPSKGLNGYANELFALVVGAERDGFRLEIDQHGRLDLVDQAGKREPINTIKVVKVDD